MRCKFRNKGGRVSPPAIIALESGIYENPTFLTPCYGEIAHLPQIRFHFYSQKTRMLIKANEA